MGKTSADYIWVASLGCVIGFNPEDIIRFEREYRELKKYGVSYWEYFSWFFQNEMDNKPAFGYSPLWKKPSRAWKKLEKMRIAESKVI